MDKATVSKLKDNLSAYLRRVRAGHTVVIYDRDVPIARIERIEDSGNAPDRLALLLAQGLVQPPVRSLPIKRLRQVLRPLPRKAGLAAALREDREDDR